jgi:hypothetical protein
LRGGATRTWQHPDSGIVWFQHLLPDLIRAQTQEDNARIWTFGYPGNVSFQTATIYDLALTLLNRVKDVRRGNEVRDDKVGSCERLVLVLRRDMRLREEKSSGYVTH